MKPTYTLLRQSAGLGGQAGSFLLCEDIWDHDTQTALAVSLFLITVEAGVCKGLVAPARWGGGLCPLVGWWLLCRVKLRPSPNIVHLGGDPSPPSEVLAHSWQVCDLGGSGQD